MVLHQAIQDRFLRPPPLVADRVCCRSAQRLPHGSTALLVTAQPAPLAGEGGPVVVPVPLHRHADAPPDGRRQSGRIRLRNATRGLNPDGYAAATERAPLTYFTVEQHYNKLVEVSGGYGERVTEAREVLPALERAMKVVLVEKRQALLNVVCDVDTNAGGD